MVYERIEEVLKLIEFPGEDEEKIRQFLQEHHFVDRVMEQILNYGHRSRKIFLWAIFSALNLLLLFFLGVNPVMVTEYFGLQNSLSQFFYLFLGLTLSGSLVGLVLSLDTTWFERLLHRY